MHEPNLDHLQERIDSARAKQRRETPDSRLSSGVSHGMRAGLDLVSGVCVGTAIGYGLDSWLGTLPWLMLVCMGLGTAAGVKLMMETSRKAAEALEKEES